MIVALLAQLREICSLILHAYTGENLVMNFRARLFRHAQRLSLSYHDWRGTVDSIYRIQYDALAVQWIMADSIIPLVTAVVTLVSMIWCYRPHRPAPGAWSRWRSSPCSS